MPEVIATLPAGEALPTAMVPFGGRVLVCYEDLRPIVVMPGADGAMKAYNAGIKPPTTVPTIAQGAASAVLESTGIAYVAYAFASSHRRVHSCLSPVASVSLAGKALTISGFEAPRDSYSTQDIDQIIVAVQLPGAPGLMCYRPLMIVDVSDGDFASASFTFDISGKVLATGHDMSRASIFAEVPPAFRFAERLDERIWFAGQRELVQFPEGATLTIANATWRGKPVSKLSLSGGGSWNDGHLGMELYVADEPMGFVWDVNNSADVYSDRRIEAGSTTDFDLRGLNDRIWHSTYHTFHAGNLPTVCPETISSYAAHSHPALADAGSTILGLTRNAGGLLIALNTGAVGIVVSKKAGLPQPSFAVLQERPGAVSQRGQTTLMDGRGAYIGPLGPVLTTAQDQPATAAGCVRLFRGEEWISLSSLAEAVLAEAGEFGGFVMGNLTVNGVGNHWLLFTRWPQSGFWLMDGQEMKSNILVYPDDNGRDVLLVGDGLGRLKRLLTPGSLVDAPAAGGADAAYTAYWQGGWDGSVNQRHLAAQFARMDSVILPGSIAAITLTIFRSHFPVRHPSDIPAANTETSSLTEASLLKDIPIKVGSWHYHSLRLGWASTSGASATGGRPMEITRWTLVFEDEGQQGGRR